MGNTKMMETNRTSSDDLVTLKQMAIIFLMCLGVFGAAYFCGSIAIDALQDVQRFDFGS